MSVQNDSHGSSSPSLQPIANKNRWAFGFGAFADQMSHQAFQFLVFTYYYAVVGISVQALAMGFIIFAIWDSINDPIIGPISDRTKSKYGRRRFWILVITIPFALMNVFLFTVPSSLSEWGKVVYMIVIIMLYDLVYTIFSTNQTALFPEMFRMTEERAKANVSKNLLTILGVLIGFVLPTIIISPMVPNEQYSRDYVASMYIETGIIIAIITVIVGFIFFKYGMIEPESHQELADSIVSIKKALKDALSNKTFVIFVTANLFTWFVFKMITTIITLYGVHVLGIGEGDLLLSLLILIALLSAAFFFPVMEKIGKKYGMRTGFMISEFVWILAAIPFAFLDNKPYLAMIFMVPMGFGLSGAMYYVDIIISQVIDEDEVRTGKRRAGTYYGVNALINRYSTILVIVAVASVLTGYGWDQYLLGASVEQLTSLRKGLKLLLVGFTMLGNMLVLILLKIFPLHGERLKKVEEEIRRRRSEEQNNI